MTKKEALKKAGYKPKRGRPRIGGPDMKTRLFNIRVTAAMHAQLKGVPPGLIREILGRAILRHANESAYRASIGGGIDPEKEKAAERVKDSAGINSQGARQRLEPQDQAPAAPQGGQVDESAAGQDKVAQPDQDEPPGGPPAAPPTVKTGWGADAVPETGPLFNE